MSAPVVDRLQVAVYTVPTDGPEGDGTLTWDSTTMVLVRAQGGDATGLGYSYTSGAAAEVVEQVLRPAVVGRPAADVPAAAVAMARAVRNLGRPGVAAAAISAVDAALWDLKARLLRLPLGELLGRVRDTVPVYGSGGFTRYDEQQLRSQVAGWRADGIARMKIKIGGSCGSRVDRDRQRVGQLREQAGPDVELFVDANGAYGPGQAVRVGQALAEMGVVWYEEPVSSDDLAGLREVRSAVAPDVAAGEYGYDLPYFGRMVGARAVDCLQVDVTRCGGITEWLRAAAVAAAAGLQVSAHCAPALHASFLVAVPDLRHLEYFHDHVRLEARFFPGYAVLRDGRLRPAAGRLGNALELDEEAAEPYRVA